MADDRLVELLRLLVPAPEEWVAEAREIASYAPADDEFGDEGDGGTHDDDRADTDQGRTDFGDADEPGEPGDPEDDGSDMWSA